jgi:hypothetical protein
MFFALQQLIEFLRGAILLPHDGLFTVERQVENRL